MKLKEVELMIHQGLSQEIARENLNQEYQEQEREFKQELEYRDMLRDIGIEVL